MVLYYFANNLGSIYWLVWFLFFFSFYRCNYCFYSSYFVLHSWATRDECCYLYLVWLARFVCHAISLRWRDQKCCCVSLDIACNLWACHSILVSGSLLFPSRGLYVRTRQESISHSLPLLGNGRREALSIRPTVKPSVVILVLRCAIQKKILYIFFCSFFKVFINFKEPRVYCYSSNNINFGWSIRLNYDWKKSWQHFIVLTI